MRTWTITALLGAALVAPAVAQTATETGAPPLHSVVFTAREGGECADRHAAQHAQCLDVVELLDMDRAWSGKGDGPRPPSAYERSVLREVGVLYEHALEDLAYRWTAGDITQTLGADGYIRLPSPGAAWERSRLDRRTYALPKQDSYFGLLDWYDPFAYPNSERSNVAFPHVRYNGPSEQTAPAATVVLAGRFAHRLGADGRSHDYDLMDADPTTSAPFFEEMFPYRGSVGIGEQSPVYDEEHRLPLFDFRFPALLEVPDESDQDALIAAVLLRNEEFDRAVAHTLVGDDSWVALQRKATAEFERFAHIVYNQTAQFAMEDVTQNHVRVLAAMTAMAVPPGALGDETGMAREIVAAAKGETDAAQAIEDQFEAEGAARPRAPIRHVQYYKLPSSVIETWLKRFGWKEGAKIPENPEHLARYHAELNSVLQRVFAKNLRIDGAYTWTDLEPWQVASATERRMWMQRNLNAGMDRKEADDRVLREALQVWLDTRFGTIEDDRRERQEEDTRLLLAQARVEVASTFDERGIRSPREVADDATERWVEVLTAHNYAPLRVDQGLGSVDPLSVCTTTDGPAALDEPSFRRLHLDLLVPVDPASVCPRDRPLLGVEPDAVDASPPGCASDPPIDPTTLDDATRQRELSRVVLWSERGAIPFLKVDHPMDAAPETEKLVDLGDGRLLYRVRWTLWSGWHLFWDSVPHGEGQRLVARTGAVCEDTVLASPQLVGTVLRGGLLTGNMRPSTPMTRKDIRQYRKERRGDSPDADQALEGAQGAARSLGGVGESAGKAAALAKSPGDSLSSVKPTIGGPAEFEIVQEDLDPHVAYLRDLAKRALQRLESEDVGSLLMVGDATANGHYRALWDMVPRTPYTRTRGKMRNGERHFRKMVDRRAGPSGVDCYKAHGEGQLVRDGGRYRCYKEPWTPPRDRHVRVAGWMWYFQPTRDRPVQVSPAYEARDSVSSDTKLPRWSRRKSADFWLAGALGAFPYRAIQYGCATTSAAVRTCRPGTLFADGYSGDLQAFGAFFLNDQPRLALEAGLEARLDVVPGGSGATARSLGDAFGASTNGNEPTQFFTLLRPAAGMMIGLRLAGRPRPLHRYQAQRSTWIAPQPDGSSLLRRWQGGLRTGFLIGPGFNGLEMSFSGELWAGHSIRRRRSKHATFTPYYPATLLGPYFRAMYGITPFGGEPTNVELPITLENSFTLMLGVRAQLRFQKATAPPELSK